MFQKLIGTQKGRIFLALFVFAVGYVVFGGWSALATLPLFPLITIDKTPAGPTKGALPYKGRGNSYLLRQTVDLTGGALTTGDVYQCLPVPKNVLVKKVEVEIITPAVGTTCTLDCGDGDGHDSWDSQFDGKAVAGTVTASAVGTDAYASAANRGKKYTAADSIDITIHAATAITAGPKFEIRAIVEDWN